MIFELQNGKKEGEICTFAMRNSDNIMISLPIHPLHDFEFCPHCGSKRFLNNDERSRRCEDCGFTYYANASASTVAVIINDRDELLVVRRAKDPAKGTLDLPGGFIDPAETAEEGMRREVLEETGAECEVGELLFTLPNAYPYSGHVVYTCDLFFRVKLADDAVLKAADDAADLFWVPLHEVHPELFGLKSISKGVERVLAERSHR